MNDYKTKSCAVYDNGLFVQIAAKLAESFGKVYYYSPWVSAFPESNHMLIGRGLDNVERVDYFWDIVPDSDLFVFPDVYHGDVQLHLDSIGKRVWGGRYGDELELYREASKRYQQSVGIDIGPYEVIKGMTDLRKYLKENDDQWIKINITRGDAETFHSPNYKQVEPRLDLLEHNLGAKKNIMTFIVERALNDCVETGYDGYCIDGQFPETGMCGVEIKDKGYVMIAHEPDRPIPGIITGVNDKLAPALKQYKYRNFYSTELRVTKDLVPYSIDLCMRAGSPPNELYINLMTNLADIIWNGAEGKLIEPVMSNKYGVELIIHSTWANQNWQTIQIPQGLEDNFKFRNVTRLNGELYVVPQISDLPEIGAVVAVGDTMEEAVEKAKDYADQIESYDLAIFPDIIEDALAQIEKLKQWGIDIT